HTLQVETPVAGKAYEIELTNGQKIHVWRADDGQQYFCHGLTFGGKEAPDAPISPFGEFVLTILRGYYEPIAEGQVEAGDLLIWRGLEANDVTHSAILTDPIVTPGKNYVDYSARLLTKNGVQPEATMTLEQLIGVYGESYNTFRRK